MDAAAEQRLVVADELRPRLLKVARRHADSSADAEDAVSIATLRVVDAPVDDPRAVESWLLTTTVRACSELRRRATVPPRAATRLTAVTAEDDPADEVCATAERAWLAALVARLPAPLRRTAEVIGSGGTYKDVARELAVTPRQARRYVGEAKERLRQAVIDARSGLVAFGHRAVSPSASRAARVPAPLWDALTMLVVIGVGAGTFAGQVPPGGAGSDRRDVVAVTVASVDALDAAAAARLDWARAVLLRPDADVVALVRAVARDAIPPRNVRKEHAGKQVGALPGVGPLAAKELETTDQGQSGGEGEGEGYRDDPPLHEWVLWCVQNVEVSPGNALCPEHGQPGGA